MIRISLCAFILTGFSAFAEAPDVDVDIRPWESALSLSPKMKYTTATIFGQGSVPTYKGFAYGAELDYLYGRPSFSFGPFFEIMTANLENTANSDAQSEKIDGTFMSGGFKLLTHYTYLKMGYSKMDVKDRASGTIENVKSFKTNGLELGAGLNYQFNHWLGVTAGLDLAYYKMEPSENPISTRLDYMSYSLVLGIRIIVPSSSDNNR